MSPEFPELPVFGAGREYTLAAIVRAAWRTLRADPCRAIGWLLVLAVFGGLAAHAIVQTSSALLARLSETTSSRGAAFLPLYYVTVWGKRVAVNIVRTFILCGYLWAIMASYHRGTLSAADFWRPWRSPQLVPVLWYAALLGTGMTLAVVVDNWTLGHFLRQFLDNGTISLAVYRRCTSIPMFVYDGLVHLSGLR
jgi:hypothetical protein